MKRLFEEPIVETLAFTVEDIITASGDTVIPDAGEWT